MIVAREFIVEVVYYFGLVQIAARSRVCSIEGREEA